MLSACGGAEDTVGVERKAVQPKATAPVTRAKAAHDDVERIRALVGVSRAMSSATVSASKALPKTKAARGKIMLQRVKDRLSRMWFHRKKDGTIKALYSPQASIPVASAAAKAGETISPAVAARRFLNTYPGLLGLDSADTLKVTRVLPRGVNGATVKFGQSHAGIPCNGGMVTVVVEDDGNIRGFISNTMSTKDLPTQAKVLATKATASLAKGDSLAAKAQAQLMYVRRPSWKTPKLAWRFVAKDKRGHGVEYWIDAVDGSQLRRHEQVHHAVTWNRELYNGDATPAQLLKTQTNCPGCPLTVAQQAAWTNTEIVSNYFDQLQRRSWDNSGNGADMETEVHTDPQGPVQTGSWDGSRVLLYHTYADNAEVVAHEWGHALANHLNLGGNAESHTLADGLADCFALAVHSGDWVFGNSGTNHVIRDAQYPVLFGGGFRNFDWNNAGQNSAQLISHICYLAGFSQTAPPSPATACDAQNPCPSAGWWPGTCINGTCVSWSNAVAVPYLGRTAGYLPFLYAIDNHLSQNATFEHLVMALTFAGCEYDVAQGYFPCAVGGASLNLAAFAAGHWRAPGRVQAGSTTFKTQHRPATIRAAREDPNTAWFAMTYRDTESGRVRVSYQNWLAADAPADAEVYGQPISTSQGLSALRGATGMGHHVSVFHVDSAEEIRVLQGNVNGDIVWTENNAIPGTKTDATPSAVSSSQGTIVFWKHTDGHIVCTEISQNGHAHYTIPNTDASSAPTAVVADGRVWLFYLGTDTWQTSSQHKVYYASANVGQGCQEWQNPTAFSEQLHGMTAIEAHYYQPTGGAVGDGRIWLFYDRAQAGGSADTQYGTRMYSFKPTSSGGMTAPSAPVFLQHTRAFGEVVYYSTYTTWDGYLHLDHPQSSDSQGPTVWRTVKLGEG